VATPFDRPPWFFADLDLGISDPRLVDLYRHWQGLRGDDDVPRVELFDPLDLTRLLGDLFVVRVEDDGLGEPAGRQPVVRYTLIGTRLVEALGRDSTGQIVGDTFLPDHPVTDLYRHIIARRAPIRTYGRMDWVQKSFADSKASCCRWPAPMAASSRSSAGRSTDRSATTLPHPRASA
jgi:hypothetical protein